MDGTLQLGSALLLIGNNLALRVTYLFDSGDGRNALAKLVAVRVVGRE